MRSIVLLGAGHAHLHIAARARELATRGAKVVLVDPGVFWYSGLATGMLGGAYCAADDQVDPKALIEACGGRFIRDRAAAVDAAARRVRLAGGETLGYDYLSLNVGSRVDIDAIPGMAGDPDVWPVKPVANLWRLRRRLEAAFAAGRAPRVAIVGGGPTGAEVAANLTALGERRGVDMPVTLVTRSARLIKQAPAGAARALRRNLRRRGVDIRMHTRIAERRGRMLVTGDGRHIAADWVVLAIGLQANPLVQATGLPNAAGRGLRVTVGLHSIADERVFAGGDCAAVEGYNLPKLGVFGVREADFIYRNLAAGLAGTPAVEYRPQRRYLAILNLGDGNALASWGPLWWLGRGSLWLKDRIDRQFVTGYRRLYSNARRY